MLYWMPAKITLPHMAAVWPALLGGGKAQQVGRYLSWLCSHVVMTMPGTKYLQLYTKVYGGADHLQVVGICPYVTSSSE